MQNYPSVPSSDLLINSRQKMLDRDDAAASNFSGTAFPTTNLLVGMKCFRTDQNIEYVLKSTGPSVWVEVMDVTSSPGTAPRASALRNVRNFSIAGDATAGVQPFDGTGPVVLDLVLSPSGVTAGTYSKVTVNSKGRVTNGASLATGDLPAVISGRTELEATRLRATSTSDVTLASTGHGFQVGPDNGLNLAVDSNEIQARNNGAASALLLNLEGGPVTIGTTGFVMTIAGTTINLDGSVVAVGSLAVTGTIDLNGAVSGTSVASLAQAQAGTNSERIMTPQRTSQQIQARIDAAISAMNNGNTNDLMSPANTFQYLQQVVGLTGKYQSGELTITSGGLLTLSHFLDLNIGVIRLSLICKTAEGGYAVNDEVMIDCNHSTSGANRMTSVRFDASNIYIRFSSNGSCFGLANKSNGDYFNITNGNWRLKVFAYGLGQT